MTPAPAGARPRSAAGLAAALALLGVLAAACTGRDAADRPSPRPPAPGTAAIDGPDGAQGMPAELRWNDTSPAWNLPGQKLLLTGTIYQP
ncbi:MAG: hypothetical protein IBJ11_11460, partial [Phycisphaerales bacterium]|nr:hypothetical protein [Phycisphaerales bacterium]